MSAGADVCCLRLYAGFMRYAQGGGLTAEGRKRREQVRLEAARRFEQRAPAAVIAAELRVSERSVRWWRQAWGIRRRPECSSSRPSHEYQKEFHSVRTLGLDDISVTTVVNDFSGLSSIRLSDSTTRR